MNLPIEEVEAIMLGCNSAGYCETCVEVDEHAGCEPDAVGYKCPECGEDTLHGFEHAFISGMVTVE